jgi:hypothetical protein
MIVKLNFTNNLDVPVTLLTNQATGQPLLAGQALEMTFELQPGPDGIADMVLICQPAADT